MSSETQDLRLQLQSLTASFSDLEEQLEPLFTQSLPETLVGLEPIQQAKLQTALAYVVYDLIFIYLKAKGINPKTHPVVSELDRIKQYFGKIQNVENPPKRTTEIDKAAASRFIKHAITEAQLQQDQQAKAQQLSWKKTRAENEAEEFSSDSAASEGEEPEKQPKAELQHKIAPKVTSKMIARQQYEQELRELQEGEDDEEGVLDVYDEADHAEGQMDVDDTPILRTVGVKPKDKGKGKANAKQLFDDTSHAPTNSMHSVTVSSKRRRPLMDPFAASGFGIGEEESQPGSASISTLPNKKPESSKSSNRDSPLQAGTSTSDKLKKRKKKKRKGE